MVKTRYRSWVLAMLLVVVMFVAGCETLKGAAQGFKRDWDNWTKADEELQRAAW